MVLALLFLSGSALLGIGIVHRCQRHNLTPLEQLLWGIVSGWSMSTAVVYLIARWQAKLNRGVVIWVTIFAFLTAIALLARSIRQLSHKKQVFRWQPEFTCILVLCCLFTPIYWQLFSSHFFAQGQNGVYSGGSAWADLSFHAAITSSFLHGDNFPPGYPVSFGKPLLYPFLPDFQTAVLMSTGISLRAALIITSLTLALATTALLFYLALQITSKPMVGILATILFLLNGGLGFIDLILNWKSSGKGFGQFWNSLTVNYANYSDHALHWPNLITDAFVPQRTILFGLPLALIVITIFARQWNAPDTEYKFQGASAFLFGGLITGLMPFFHTHTFLALGLVSGFLFLLRPNRLWIMFWLPAILVPSPYLFSLLAHTGNGGFLRLQPGWMGHSSTFFPWYLLRNLGVPLLMAIPAWFALPRIWRRFYLAFVLLLVFSLIVVVSPNLFDNGKLIYYWHAVNSIIVAHWLIRLAFEYRQALVATILALLSIATGITALQSESLQSVPLFSNEEIAAASFVIEQTSPRSLFLTAPVTNQSILCLAGRPILRGATAWLWSHGYEFRDREADVRRIYAGTQDAQQLLQYYGIDYVFLGAAEREQFQIQPAFFDANFPAVYRSSTITIYDARRLKQGQRTQPSFEKRIEYDPFSLLGEFEDTSFFVYRSWIATHARMPNLMEFREAMRLLAHDVAVVSQDVVRFEMNRDQLISDMTKEFDGLSNGDYVDRLLTNARLTGNDKLRQELTTGLDQGHDTKASVLRKIVDNRELYKREYNTAFVLTHYYGYLDRNPNDPPDSGLEGLNYWRSILDNSKDYRSISRAFLESNEYKKRPIR